MRILCSFDRIMNHRPWNLLDEALGLDQHIDPWPLKGQVVLIEDCVETSGSFVLHQLLKRTISQSSSNFIIFLAFAQPFCHYDRILKKLGCNLISQRDNNRLLFFDMRMLHCPVGAKGKTDEGGLIALYQKVWKAIGDVSASSKNRITIMIDDVSLLEVAANGSSDYALDFLHYCHTLTSEFGCSLVTLNHEDIYSSMESPSLMLQMKYYADILIKAEPLATGLATDVHGQLTVLNKGICPEKESSKNKIRNFHFKIRENSVEYFYPGSRT